MLTQVCVSPGTKLVRRRFPVSVTDILESTVDIPDIPLVSPETRVDEPAEAKLEGRLGVVELIFNALAYNAPLVSMAGYVTLVVGYGNGLGAPATFVAIGVVFAVFAIGLVAMSRYMRSPGAFYSYIAAGLGRPAGLGGAFIALTGYLAVAISSYAYGGIVVKGLVEELHGPQLPWWLWAAMVWVMVSALTLRNISLSMRFLKVALIAETAIVVAWDTRVLFSGGAHGIVSGSFTPGAFTSGSLALALVYGALCITGFESLAVYREETRDPTRTIPRATYAVVIILCTTYGLGALAYLTAYGTQRAIGAAKADPVGSMLGSIETYLGTVGLDVASLLLITSGIASLLATQNISARYLYTLGSDGVLPSSLARVHSRYKSPHIAAASVAGITLAGFASAALAGISPIAFYSRLAGFGAVCLLALMTATAAAIFVYFRRDRFHRANVLESTVSPVLAFLGLGTAFLLAVKYMPLLINGTTQTGLVVTFIGLAIIATGVGMAIALKIRRPAVYLRIGRQDL